MTPERFLDELALFADLGADPPRLTGDGDRFAIRLWRGGEEVELEFGAADAGRIVERTIGTLDSGERRTRTHASYAALLASEKFGNLRRWADAQKAFLESRLKSLDRNLVNGVFSEDGAPAGLEAVDDALATPERRDAQSVQVLLIDGPAGIGKTKFIEHLALSRAANFKRTGRPLILHVQSRGRVLTFLQDLIAFSLQTLRLGVTYDQAPVLARHGLIAIAIDGFDELGDPNGYDLAWGQVNELVNQVRGGGTLVLAGRETFIGRERLLREVSSLSEDRDAVRALSLQPPNPSAAKEWLERHDWSREDLGRTAELFEDGSYALRPFFLAQLADGETAAAVRKAAAGSPLLPFLVDLMIEREASKFGERVENVMSDGERRAFVRAFLREVARNMADDQTEALDDSMISWLVEIAVPDGMSAEVTALLRNRAAVMAFLTLDDRPKYRRFAHSQLLNHFLGEETVDRLAKREMPRYVRRNILGADFLSVFGDLTAHLADSDPERIRNCFDAASELARNYLWTDRGARNLGGLLVAMLPAIEDAENLQLEDLHVDEALLQDVAPPARLVRVVMNQFDVRGADLRELRFEDATIVTLIGDRSTRIPASIPVPSIIRNEGDGGDRFITDPEPIGRWLDSHGRRPVDDDGETGHAAPVPAALHDHDLVRLLERACRSRAYWIPERREGDDRGNRFVDEDEWPELRDLLKEHDLVRVEKKASSGRVSDFLHIVNRRELLQGLWNESEDPKVRAFYRELVERTSAPG